MVISTKAREMVKAVITDLTVFKTVKAEDGSEQKVATGFNLALLDEFITEIRSQRKAIAGDKKEQEKVAKANEQELLAEIGKAYYKSLKLGEAFQYKNASGEILDAIKIETKSKSDATAACELVNPPEDAKNTKRYPKFWQVVVTDEFKQKLMDDEKARQAKAGK